MGFLKNIKRNSINVQIAVAFATLLVIIVGLQILAYFWVDRLPAINELKADFAVLQKEQLILKGAANEFILKESTNEQFFANGTSQYLEQYSTALENCKNYIGVIESKSKSLGLEKDSELDALKGSILRYDQLFTVMVDKIKVRGYGKHGLIGEFDKSMADLMVYDFGVDNVAILNLKLYVKEYLLTGDEAATKNVANEIYNFSVVLEKYVQDNQVDSVVKTLGHYETIFQKLVETDKELGLYTSSGLKGELFFIMGQIDKMIQLEATNEKIENAYNNITTGIYLSFVFVIVSALIAALVISIRLYRSLVIPIHKIKDIIVRIGQGEIPKQISAFKLSDVNEMGEAVNNLIQGMKDHQEFADNIGKGNLDASFNLMNEKDVLGASLLNMRDSLKKVEEDNRERNWGTQGIAEFAEVLRNNNDDLKSLGDNIVSKLVKYLKVNQAGLYLVNDESDEDIHMNLISCYAYERKKYKKQRIELGEGLLGQAVLEKEMIYVTTIPQAYTRISSGLGEATPNVLMIVPLKQDKMVFGAIEIASFKPIARYEKEFVEKVAHNIASTISTVRINEKNKQLLRESQERAEILKAQEEMMRQQMEELEATQEQIKRNMNVEMN